MKIKKILLGDLNYPFYLSQIKNPPSRLYVIGNEEILRERSMAIVGCRECSNYGKKIASGNYTFFPVWFLIDLFKYHKNQIAPSKTQLESARVRYIKSRSRMKQLHFYCMVTQYML